MGWIFSKLSGPLKYYMYWSLHVMMFWLPTSLFTFVAECCLDLGSVGFIYNEVWNTHQQRVPETCALIRSKRRKQDAAAAPQLTVNSGPLSQISLFGEKLWNFARYPRADAHYGCHQGFGAVVQSALRGLPRCGHHQHDHVFQERIGFLRAHTQVQTGPDVSRFVPSLLIYFRY